MSDSALASAPIPPQAVLAFCAEHQLLEALPVVLQLAEHHFQPLDAPLVEVETDPEAGGEYMVISVAVAAGIEEVLKRYDAFTSQWVQSIPAQARDFIRLTYDIFEE